MILHLIRHGDTVTSGRSYAGRLDVALSPRGRAQAEALVDQLADRPIGAILTSPLGRAVDTARPLARHFRLEPQLCPELIEFDFGALEGQPKATQKLSLKRSHQHDPVPGGESLHDLWCRLKAVETRLRGLDTKGREVAAVGHYWSNRLLAGRLAGQGFKAACQDGSYRPETGSAIRIVIRDRLLEPSAQEKGAL